MRENGVHQLFFSGFEIHGNYVALDQFGDFGTDHVRTEQLAGLVVKNHLDQSLILSKSDRLAITGKREPADPNLMTGFLCLRLRQTDLCNLRIAVGATGDEIFIYGMRM